MPRLCLVLSVLLITSIPQAARGGGLAGSYVAISDVGAFSLTLEQTGEGRYEGVLSGDGGQLVLDGRLDGETLVGRTGDGVETFSFQIVMDGGGVLFTLYGHDENGTPDSGSGETLLFERVEGGTTSSAGGVKPVEGKVVINGHELTPDEVGELGKAYGVAPLAGQYWYDPLSGLYGVIGYPAYGFMRPGHEYGRPDPKASNGDTGVIINGRELPMSEFTVWSYIVGSWIQPGAYWLDHYGNAGYEGNPTPVINLYTAAQQNSYGGKGSGGDNFWSTRFSAGNYNEDNSQGYVSVPGYGPVGYGF